MLSKLQLPVRKSICLYRLLVLLYPSSFRKEFGEEMVIVFSDLLANAAKTKGSLGFASAWFRVVTDLLFSVLEQHFLVTRERVVMLNKTWTKPFIFGVCVTITLIGITTFVNATIKAKRAETMLNQAQSMAAAAQRIRVDEDIHMRH
jgi:hypothetical protein